MRAFNLRATLQTPVEIARPLHLDGLLLAARERRENLLDLSRPLECVAMEDGVYRASAGFLVAQGLFGVAVDPMYRTWRFRNEDFGTLSTFAVNKDMPAAERRLGTANSKYRNGFRRHDVLTGVASVVWQCVGDPEAVLALARHIRGIGQSATTGYGRVRDWSLEACDVPDAEAAWVSGGRVLRNLPARMLPPGTTVDPLHASLDVQRPAPPYWDREGREECWIPTLSSLTGDVDTLDEVMRGSDEAVLAA